MNVVLISTYELGRQPFGLASPAAWLRRAGADVQCLDLSRELFREDLFRNAALIAFYVPMHTATRLAIELIEPVRRLNPDARLCFYGLYAPINESHLRKLGVDSILGGEFEEGLVKLYLDVCKGGPACSPLAADVVHTDSGGQGRLDGSATVSLARQSFLVPDRAGLPALKNYAHLIIPGDGHRIAGYSEASRGCKHRCRHCPIVPVYNGAFRIVQRDVVLADIRQQISAGAQHITFGDPDFFNGPAHAVAIVEALHREFPRLTYDVTIKIEHILQHRELIHLLKRTGCAFVISAVESVDDSVLEKLDKGHTRAGFLRVLGLMSNAELPLQPTFVPFTPWTTIESYCDLLRVVEANNLIERVAPIQLAIRLLIPAGSRLLELNDVQQIIGPFDEASLVYPWDHPDPRVDVLLEELQEIVRIGEKLKHSRESIFTRIWRTAHNAAGARSEYVPPEPALVARAAVPYLNEPWYC
jgi:radical SAM superfamily enzyme YgiQ (UPF0313 family)